MSNQANDEFKDEGLNKPIPSFDASAIKLTTIAPALGVADDNTPDYLDYDTDKGRGIMVTMFANAGLSYLLGTLGGGLYGLSEGLKNTPSNRFKVKLNSVLNHCSRHGSRIGNMAGCLSIFYSFYEYAADNFELDRYTDPVPVQQPLAAFMTGATYKAFAGPRVAALAGTIGLGSVGVTYGVYSVLGYKYGQKGWLFF
ncbi:hypothetical protein CTEN210_09084 [Chaetoceros tenuissimus]|uniref:Mitochondrial import inner membrane translocase subunit TIM23 n=1 Tax=Chaetoceros tenuissimus TaxID=426638 RepID=A0AAD3H795_9STRA|nr:hypothetical protein CTEN210_09084 [Chaetoceros tenuissimus]